MFVVAPELLGVFALLAAVRWSLAAPAVAMMDIMRIKTIIIIIIIIIIIVITILFLYE